MGSDPRGWLGPQRSAARQAPRQGFKPPPPGRRSADWKFHIDRHQPRAEQQLLGGALPALRVYSRVQTPQTPPLTEVPTPVPSPASKHADGVLRDGTDAPRLSCAAGVRPRGAKRPRGVRAGPASLRGCPRTGPRDHLRLAPRARPGRAPTHPSRAVAGRARTRASLLPRPCSYPSFRLAL